MRRFFLLGLAVLALAGCGSTGVGNTFPKKVVGTVKTESGSAAGKALFASNGCGSCHTYKPAASTGKVGPDLDKLAADAQKANKGSLEDYTRTSIEDPNAYVVPGFPSGVMPEFKGTLTDSQIDDLVAYLTKKS